MSENHHDLTRPPDLRHGELSGLQRTRRPLFVDLLPPCNQACPAGENIQAWLSLAQQGRFQDAWGQLVLDNPMPAVHGRVCYHPCEDHCNRERVDSTVSIHAVERYLGDLALERGWEAPQGAASSGRRVLVVGAGPSGLACAYHLARLGHVVEIRDAGPMAGGMMHFGIPKYRLPRDVLDAEVARIQALGVVLTLNHKVEDLQREKEDGGFDAAFVAIGAHLSQRTDIPARDATKILDAMSFLRDVEKGATPKLGRRVAVYGGGNTAMDAARTVKRLGFEPLIVYRRDRDHMPAHEFEAADAVEEGVRIHWLRTIKEIDETELRVEVMRLNDQGRPEPTGEFETLEADCVILALGQKTDSAFLRKVPGAAFQTDGTVVVDEAMMTGCPGVFAGGDMVPAERTVTTAVGHGKKAARHIDAWLRGGTYAQPEKHELASFDRLHMWYFTDAAQSAQPQVDLQARQTSFEEVVKGLSDEEARFEASRCLSCGNCFECDGCYGACPEKAVFKIGAGKRYRFEYDKCTGCAVCFEQCPCGAIEMIPEPIAAGDRA
jgi:NADPH-dependent glutamate synthase beta subunit-like oxidoreductase